MQAQDFDIEAVPVTVKNINFDGLLRTKPDFVSSAVKNVYNAKTFGDLLVRIRQAEDVLKRLEAFKEVAVIVDVDRSGAQDVKAGDGYDVTFVVKEFGRLAASAKTQMGAQADAQMKIGLRMPNLCGRGERMEVEYSYSSTEEKNAEISLFKPFPTPLDSGFKSTIFHSTSPNSHARYVNSGLGTLLSYFCGIDLPTLPFCSVNHKVEYEGTWRELTPISLATPFSVRQDLGSSFKSAVRHILTLDSRNRSIFPTAGTYANFQQELAGIFGDAKYHKVDVDVQNNIPLPLKMSFQTSLRLGSLIPFGTSQKRCGISDKFFMGGPNSLRGFALRGVNCGQDGISLGGMAYWAAAAHLYSPLLFVNRKYPMVENCRVHLFVNAGNLADQFLAGDVIKNFRLTYGAGLAVALGNFGRLEINYCWPIKSAVGDKRVKGLQVGVGVHFL